MRYALLIVLLFISFRIGKALGKRGADRWYAEHPIIEYIVPFTTGTDNTAIGEQTLEHKATGPYNTFLGPF